MSARALTQRRCHVACSDQRMPRTLDAHGRDHRRHLHSFIRFVRVRGFEGAVLSPRLLHGAGLALALDGRNDGAARLGTAGARLQAIGEHLASEFPVLRARARRLDFEDDAAGCVAQLDGRRRLVLAGSARPLDEDAYDFLAARTAAVQEDFREFLLIDGAGAWRHCSFGLWHGGREVPDESELARLGPTTAGYEARLGPKSTAGCYGPKSTAGCYEPRHAMRDVSHIRGCRSENNNLNICRRRNVGGALSASSSASSSASLQPHLQPRLQPRLQLQLRPQFDLNRLDHVLIASIASIQSIRAHLSGASLFARRAMALSSTIRYLQRKKYQYEVTSVARRRPGPADRAGPRCTC
jgi:hypothetical protein